MLFLWIILKGIQRQIFSSVVFTNKVFIFYKVFRRELYQTKVQLNYVQIQNFSSKTISLVWTKKKRKKSFFQNFCPLLMRVWNKIVKKTKSHYSSTLSNCYQYNQHNKVQTNWKSLTCFSNALCTFLKFFFFICVKSSISTFQSSFP